jgi:hypothetical protein
MPDRYSGIMTFPGVLAEAVALDRKLFDIE